GRPRRRRDIRNDDRIALPGVVERRQEHRGNGSLVIGPDELLDLVRAARLPPPPLHVSRFPDPRVGVCEASALQEPRRHVERRATLRSNLLGGCSHLIASGLTAPPTPPRTGRGPAARRKSYRPSAAHAAASASSWKISPSTSPM